MTHDELVDLGKVLRAVQKLSDEVQKLREEVRTAKNASEAAFSATQEISRMVAGLSCVADDTDPDVCPARGGANPRRQALASMSGDEPDSVVTREMSVGAGPVRLRGPAIMITLTVALLVVGALVANIDWRLVLTHALGGVP